MIALRGTAILLLIALLVSPRGAWAQADVSGASGSREQRDDPGDDEDRSGADLETERRSLDRPVEEEPEPPERGPDAGVAPPGVEEIVVVGQAIVMTQLDTAASIATFDAEDLEAMGANTIADLAMFTPSLQIQQAFAASNPTIFIRGIGLDDFNSNAAGAVAVISDGIYMNSPVGQLGQFFDVGSVEVLRGPQGIYHGRNASAGAILIHPRQPSGDVGAGAQFTYGNFDLLEFDGFAEAPLVEDLLSIRGAYHVRTRDGFAKNRCGNPDNRNVRNTTFCNNADNRLDLNPPPESKVNDEDNWALRGLARLEFEWGEFNLNVHGGHNRSLATSFQKIGLAGEPNILSDSRGYLDPDTCLVPNPNTPDRRKCALSARTPEDGDRYAGDYNRTGPERIDLFGASLNGEFSLDRWRLSSISGYEQSERLSKPDLDASPFVSLEIDFRDVTWQATQELQIEWGNQAGDLRLTLGGFYLHETLEADNLFVSNTRLGNRLEYEQITDYVAGYGQLIWDVSDAITLEGGGRFGHERKEFSLLSSVVAIQTGNRGIFREETTRGKLSEPSGEIVLRYRPTENLGTYLKYVHGVKGLHFNGSAVQEAALIEPVNPEFVDMLELGWDTAWLDGLFGFNGAAFAYSYKDQQIFQVRNASGRVPTNELINAQESQILGVEFDFTTNYEGFQTFTSFSYLFSRYTDFTNNVTRVIAGPGGGAPLIDNEIQNFSGNQLVSSPEFFASGYAEYAFDLGRYGRLTPRFDYSWRDRVFFSAANSPLVGDEPLLLMNARLAYAGPSDSFEIAIWVHNLGDEVYRATAFDLGQINDSIVYVMGRPRTFGLTLNLRF